MKEQIKAPEKKITKSPPLLCNKHAKTKKMGQMKEQIKDPEKNTAKS